MIRSKIMKQLTDITINSFSGRIHPQGAGRCVYPLGARTSARRRGLLRLILQNRISKGVLHKVVQDAVRLLGLLIAFGVFGAQAQAAEESLRSSGAPTGVLLAGADAQNSITALSVSTGNGTTVIKVELAQPLANLPAGFAINTPPRIAFDFPNTANGLGKSVQDFTEGDLHSANIVQAGSLTRLVVNLNQMLIYDTKIDGKNLLITLHGKAPEIAVANSTERFAEARQGTQQHELRDIDFRRGKNGEGRIQVDLSDPGIGIDIRQQGTTLIVDFLKTNLPRNLQRKLRGRLVLRKSTISVVPCCRMSIPIPGSERSTWMRPSPFLPRRKSMSRNSCCCVPCLASAKRSVLLATAISGALPCKVISRFLPSILVSYISI